MVVPNKNDRQNIVHNDSRPLLRPPRKASRRIMVSGKRHRMMFLFFFALGKPFTGWRHDRLNRRCLLRLCSEMPSLNRRCLFRLNRRCLLRLCLRCRSFFRWFLSVSGLFRFLHMRICRGSGCCCGLLAAVCCCSPAAAVPAAVSPMLFAVVADCLLLLLLVCCCSFCRCCCAASFFVLLRACCRLFR